MDVDTNEKRGYKNCIRLKDKEPVVMQVLFAIKMSLSKGLKEGKNV